MKLLGQLRVQPRVQTTSLLALLALTAGCGSDGGGADVPADCNALNGSACVLPFPSSVYQRADATSPTGVRLDLGAESLPVNVDGVRVKPDYYNQRNGFSANAPILVAFAGGVDPTLLPPVTNPGKSLEPGSPTVLVDMTTGQRVPHFAELDATTKEGVAPAPERQALIIWPMVKLEGNRRFAVGIRKTLKTRVGGELPISPGFTAMLAGKASGHARLDRVRDGYPAIFSALETAGVPRTDLALAWDFHTATDESVQSDLKTARERALAVMGNAGANLTFRMDNRQASDLDPAITKRVVFGTFDVPLVLTDNGSNESVLARDATGKPMVVGTYQAPFGAIIPACVDQVKPVPILIYGHGLLGSHTEAVEASYVRKVANHLCVVLIATDWRGMSQRDVSTVGFGLNDMNIVNRVFEQMVQGVLSFVALGQIARGPMASSDLFKEGGVALLDPTRQYYYGISQGGIYGAVLMANDPHITRGALAVGGANYSLMIQRSSNWPKYGSILAGAYRDALEQQVLISLLQMVWDPVDPVTWAAHLSGKAPPVGVPQKQILMQIAVGDSQVPNVSAELQARIQGLPVLGPSIYPTYGLEVKPGPLGSAITFFDENKQPEPLLSNLSNGDNGTHGSVRKLKATNDQLKRFFETGEIVQTCQKTGAPVACDCTDTEICGPQI